MDWWHAVLAVTPPGKERKGKNMTNYRVYTGPTLVQAVAEKLRTVDTILVTLEGTEHVYVKAPSVRDVLSGLVPNDGMERERYSRDAKLIIPCHLPEPSEVAFLCSKIGIFCKNSP